MNLAGRRSSGSAVTVPPRLPDLVASGYVVARRKATVSAEVTAKVVEVLVHEGTAVKKGDVLARLDSVLPERDLMLARSKADGVEAGIGAIAADLQDAERIMNRNLRLRQGHAVAEGELEAVMMDYLRGGADVLVCTSIIESGIDIPQANTLLVEHADNFGLAQLYQIRGRVGRSRERADAYLLYTAAAALTPEAAQRLSALSDYTELGSGFKIAMRDLELRGAGNLLGDEQSGHVAALGFELYMQMLDEAVRQAGPAEGEQGEELPEPVRLDVNVNAYVPADYVPYEQAKIEVHRRVASALEVADVERLREELEDRFGPVPEPLGGYRAQWVLHRNILAEIA